MSFGLQAFGKFLICNISNLENVVTRLQDNLYHLQAQSSEQEAGIAAAEERETSMVRQEIEGDDDITDEALASAMSKIKQITAKFTSQRNTHTASVHSQERGIQMQLTNAQTQLQVSRAQQEENDKAVDKDIERTNKWFE